MLGEPFRMAAGSFRSNRLRAFLSLIGIVIGVGSVVAVTSIAESGTADIRRQFASLGLDAVTVYPQWDEKGPSLNLTPALLADLAREVPNVKAVLRKSGVSGRVNAGTRVHEGTLMAVESPFFAAMGLPFDQGRAFEAADEYLRKPLVVLGDEAARVLFPEGSPVGKGLTVTFDRTAVGMTVAGVLAKKDSSFGDDWNRSVFVSYSFLEGRVLGAYPVQSAVVVATARDRVVALTAAVQKFFLEETSRPNSVYVSSPQEWAENNEKMTATISLILTGIAAISLLVGGIGVMNIMLVSVAERKREIGIRKALGATPGTIRAQFLVESILLTLVGGVLGLGVGSATAWAAVSAFHWTFTVSGGTAVLAFGVSAGTGVFFGFYPAVRASRLDPVEALASE